MQSRRELLKSATALAASPLLLQEPARPAPATDVFADFESGTFDGWALAGNCWTKEPHTAATIEGITGFQGKRYLCTLHPRLGHTARGNAVSREFTIEKPFITFLIGGGNHPGQACLNLIVDGRVVRTATGHDSADMRQVKWDVADLQAKSARFEVIDDVPSGPRGYVMVDDIQFVTTTSSVQTPNLLVGPLQRQVEVLADKWRTAYGLPGVWCAVVRNNRLAACFGTGYKNVKTGATASLSDHLNCGSVSKAVTGSLIAQFVGRRAISYEVTVGTLFPELVKKHPNSPLIAATLGQALAHTAGLPPGDMNTSVGPESGGINWREGAVEFGVRDTRLVRPGTRYLYSNFGLLLAVAMAERKLGRKSSYEDWIGGPEGKAIGISTPLSLDWSKDVSADEVCPHFVDQTGVVTTNDKGMKGRPSTLRVYAPQGSCSLTLPDMASFVIGILTNSAHLPDDVYERVCRLRENDAVRSDTYGSWHLDSFGQIYHQGNTGRGEFAVIRIEPKRKSGYVLYTNCASREPTDDFIPAIERELTNVAFR